MAASGVGGLVCPTATTSTVNAPTDKAAFIPTMTSASSMCRCSNNTPISVDSGEFVFGSGEADLESFDFAEPAFAFGFGNAGNEVVSDLYLAVTLSWIRPEEGAADTSFSELGNDHWSWRVSSARCQRASL